VITVGLAIGGHRPDRLIGHRPCRVDLGCGPHHAIALETQPVAAAGQLADVADRAAAHQLGELEDLGDGQDRAFRRVLAARAPDPTRVTRQNPVILNRRCQDRA